jgi:hypothetical protein
MLNKLENYYEISDDSEKWIARHPLKSSNGPLSLSYKNDTVIENCEGYASPLTESMTIPRKVKGFHKSGTTVLEFEGYLPTGASQLDYNQSYKYSNRRVKVTTDVSFQHNTSVARHFGVGSLFLPGKWKEMSFIPPGAHIAHGAKNRTMAIPTYTDSPIMLGHWHRPPLSVTFKRPNGLAVEIGTGSDLWRWEENLGYAPESGSYKITLEKDGIRFIREPLACCEEFSPDNRAYRFSWYIAWRENGANRKLPQHHAIKLPLSNNGELDTKKLQDELSKKSLYAYIIIDIDKFNWTKDQCRVTSPYNYIRNIVDTKACWSVTSVITRIKNIIRKLHGIDEVDGIIFKNLTPGVCFCPSHVSKSHENGTAHWDINGFFDLASWATNLCEGKLQFFMDNNGALPPALEGLFE